MLVRLLHSEWIKTLITASFGWLLSSLSQYLLAWRTRREAIGRALSDLLEIRHQLLAVDKALDEIRKIVPMPPELETQFRVALEQHVLPDSQGLSKRYDESVTLISAVDPILGYRLRSKDLTGPLLRRLNALMIQHPRSAPFGLRVTKLLLPHVDMTLASAIKSLAWRHGPVTRWKTAQVLRSPQLPKEASELVDLLREEGAKQQKAAVTPTVKITPKQIWIVAIDHELQLSPEPIDKPDLAAKKKKLQTMLSGGIPARNVGFISEEAKANTSTIASDIANAHNPKIPWRNIIMTDSEREAAGIKEALSKRPGHPDYDTMETWIEIRIPEDEIREDFFISQTLQGAAAVESVLMLVGDMHVEAVAEKLRKMGHQVVTNHELCPVKRWE